jgi:hypothetical protein
MRISGHLASQHAPKASGSMMLPLRALLAALALLVGLICLAQPNVASASTPPSGSRPLTGSQLAAVSYSIIWEVGSPPYSFRILRGQYWTDASGQPIPWRDVEPRPPGEKYHAFTRIILGRASFSLPMPPLAVALIGTAIILALGYILVTHVANRRASDKPHQPQNTCTTKSN